MRFLLFVIFLLNVSCSHLIFGKKQTPKPLSMGEKINNFCNREDISWFELILIISNTDKKASYDVILKEIDALKQIKIRSCKMEFLSRSKLK